VNYLFHLFIFVFSAAVAPLHLEPFTINDLNMMRLYERIHKCPQLNAIDCIYPNRSKAGMLRLMAPLPTVTNPADGYLATEMIMIVKTGFEQGQSDAVVLCQ
jgi:hypothetical protein